MKTWRIKLLLAVAFVFVVYTVVLAISATLQQQQDQHLLQSQTAWDVVKQKHANRPSVLGVSQQPRPIYRPAVKPKPIAGGTLAPAVARITTTEPVIFITIDDGLVPSEGALTLMQQRGAVASLFLNDVTIKGHHDYFRRWQAAGSTIQNHTVNHLLMTTLPLATQQQEFCTNQTMFAGIFGKPPTLARAPYGEYNQLTQQAARTCGAKALVQWSATVNDGMHYQDTDRLHPGDIVLLHFRPNLEADLQALFTAADAQQLQIGKLEDWLY